MWGYLPRKVLAKMASDFEKPNKVHTLFPEEVSVKMWPLPIGELFMAGSSSVETMKSWKSIQSEMWRIQIRRFLNYI